MIKLDWGDPTFDSWCSYQKRARQTDTRRGEGPVRTEAGSGLGQLQAKDTKDPGSQQKLPRGRKYSSLDPSEGAWPYQHLDA